MIDFIVSYEFIKPLLRHLKTVCFNILAVTTGVGERV